VDGNLKYKAKIGLPNKKLVFLLILIAKIKEFSEYKYSYYKKY